VSLSLGGEGTSALVAVGHATWCTVVPGANHALLTYYAAADPSLHTVTPASCQICQLHKVLVPARPHAGFVHEVQVEYRASKRVQVGRRVEQLELCSLAEGAQACRGRKQVLIIA
jgi:hypothetical protein